MENSLSDGLIFSQLTTEHVSELVALEHMCFSTPWGQEQYEAAFLQKSFFAYGLWKNSTQGNAQGIAAELIAYIVIYYTFDEIEILNIAVTPSQRQQGVGEFLLRNLLETVQKSGAQRGVLEVRVHNTPARKLYEKLGFVCVGTRKKYYADTGEDACVYELAL